MLLVDAMTGATLPYRDVQFGVTTYRGVPIQTIRSCRRRGRLTRDYTMILADGRCVPLQVRWTHPNFFGRRVAFIPS